MASVGWIWMAAARCAPVEPKNDATRTRYTHMAWQSEKKQGQEEEEENTYRLGQSGYRERGERREGNKNELGLVQLLCPLL